MTPDEMSFTLKNETISGFVSWEPHPAKAVIDGYGRYLVNSKDIWPRFINFRNCLAITNAFAHREVDIAAFGAGGKSGF